MRKCVDYIREHELEAQRVDARIKELTATPTPEKMQLLGKIIETELNQYHFIKDKARRDRLEHHYYPLLCELARLNGGRAELDVDETYYYGTISYTGKELTLDKSFVLEMRRFTELLQDTDTFTAAADGDYMKLTFTFEMNQKVHVTDHSDELNHLRDEYRKL